MSDCLRHRNMSLRLNLVSDSKTHMNWFKSKLITWDPYITLWRTLMATLAAVAASVAAYKIWWY